MVLIHLKNRDGDDKDERASTAAAGNTTGSSATNTALGDIGRVRNGRGLREGLEVVTANIVLRVNITSGGEIFGHLRTKLLLGLFRKLVEGHSAGSEGLIAGRLPSFFLSLPIFLRNLSRFAAAASLTPGRC